jgi:hypothetical protein
MNKLKRKGPLILGKIKEPVKFDLERNLLVLSFQDQVVMMFLRNFGRKKKHSN